MQKYNAYRYGFNGQERDDEVKGSGNSYNYTYRMHDPRLGRFFAVDPLHKDYPQLTTYQFASNSVIGSIEIEGLEGKPTAKPFFKLFGHAFYWRTKTSITGKWFPIYHSKAKRPTVNSIPIQDSEKDSEIDEDIEGEREVKTKTINHLEIVQTVVKYESGRLPVKKQSEINKDYNEVIDANGEDYEVVVNAYGVPDRVKITNEETGAVLYDQTGAKKHKYSVPNDVTKFRIQVFYNKIEGSSAYKVKVSAERYLVKETTTSNYTSGELINRSTTQEMAKSGEKAGDRTKTVNRTKEEVPVDD